MNQLIENIHAVLRPHETVVYQQDFPSAVRMLTHYKNIIDKALIGRFIK